MEEKSFNEILNKCYDEVFIGVFGRECAKAMYYHLGKKFGETMGKPKRFSEDLHRLLGQGAYYIEEGIIQKLYRELAIEYVKKEGHSFIRSIEEAKKALKDSKHTESHTHN